jgi:hypothetical protein
MHSTQFFTDKQLDELHVKLQTIEGRTNNLLLKCTIQSFASQKAQEFARQGFGRRIQTVRRCIHRVFEIVPPETVIVPDRDQLFDAQINLQAFYANVFGAADNLAWIWVHERGLAGQIKPLRVGLRKKNTAVRNSLPADFRNYLETMDRWFEYVTEYRDALAHRIPLYIPPGAVRESGEAAANELQAQMNAALVALKPFEYERLAAEQAKLFFFYPIMTHSLQKTAGIVYFHPQIIADFGVIEEIALKMLDALQGLHSTKSPQATPSDQPH